MAAKKLGVRAAWNRLGRNRTWFSYVSPILDTNLKGVKVIQFELKDKRFEDSFRSYMKQFDCKLSQGSINRKKFMAVFN